MKTKNQKGKIMTDNETLREQAARIRPGDKVTARFKVGEMGEFTITGEAYDPSALTPQATLLAGHTLRYGPNGGPGVYLTEIIEHTPAPKPLPTEPGSMVRVHRVHVGRRWLTYDLCEDGLWYLDDGGGVDGDGGSLGHESSFFSDSECEWYEVVRKEES